MQFACHQVPHRLMTFQVPYCKYIQIVATIQIIAIIQIIATSTIKIIAIIHIANKTQDNAYYHLNLVRRYLKALKYVLSVVQVRLYKKLSKR